MSTNEESLLTRVANRDRKIGHLEDKVGDLTESRSRRHEVVSVWSMRCCGVCEGVECVRFVSV